MDLGFSVERLERLDAAGVPKASLVAKRGAGSGGLAFLSHVDTVPGNSWSSDPLQARIESGRLIGLGSCDMKGPLATTIAAASAPERDALRHPVYVVITADEETTGLGAINVVEDSESLGNGPEYGIVAEPTRLEPVYAHKGTGRAVVTAHGRAAHSSTGLGESANFRIAAFLHEMADLARQLEADEAFLDPAFEPPHLCLNMTIDDGGTRPNVTAPRSVCTLSFRPMPEDRSGELLALIERKAKDHGHLFEGHLLEAFAVSPESRIVREAVAASGAEAHTVGYGTDAIHFRRALEQMVVLGPGDIAQAHTDGEWIEISQLERAVEVYGRLIDAFCS